MHWSIFSLLPQILQQESARAVDIYWVIRITFIGMLDPSLFEFCWYKRAYEQGTVSNLKESLLDTHMCVYFWYHIGLCTKRLFEDDILKKSNITFAD